MIEHYFSIWCKQVVYYVQNIQKSRSEHTTKNSRHDWTSMHQLNHSVFAQKKMNVIENLQTQIQQTQISEIKHIWKQALTMFYNSFIIHIRHSIFCVNVEINVLLIEIFIDSKIKYYIIKISSYVKQFLQELVNKNAINKHLNFDLIIEQIDFNTLIAFNIVNNDDFNENVAF